MEYPAYWLIATLVSSLVLIGVGLFLLSGKLAARIDERFYTGKAGYMSCLLGVVLLFLHASAIAVLALIRLLT